MMFITLFLSVAHAAGICTTDFDKLQSKNTSLYEKAKASQPNSAELDKCYGLIKKKIDNCQSQFESKPCSDESATETVKGGKGLEGTMTGTVKLQVNQANCGYVMASCFKMGGMFDEGESDKATACMIENAAKHEADVQDTGTRAQAAKSAGIVYYVINVGKEITKPQIGCWVGYGRNSEAGARKSLTNAKASRADGRSTAAIDCLNQDNGNRICVYRDSGGSQLKELKEDESGKTKIDKASPAQLGKSSCSGTLLGDGTTVVSAAHCTADGKDGEQEIRVFDKTGKAQSVTGNCKAGIYSSESNADVTTCTLSKKVDSNPVYFATADSKVSGSRCEDDGFVMRCGEGFFENLTQKRVTQYAYPAQLDLQSGEVRQDLFRSVGANYYDKEKKYLNYDALCTGGCSGSGIMVDVNGRQVAVAAASVGSRYEASSGAPVTTYETFRGLTVQSVSKEKLEAGSALFQEMPIEP